MCWGGGWGLPSATKGPEKPLAPRKVGLPWLGSEEACGFPQGFTPGWLLCCPSRKTKLILLPAMMLPRLLAACWGGWHSLLSTAIWVPCGGPRLWYMRFSCSEHFEGPEISPGPARRLERTVTPKTFLMGPLQMELTFHRVKALCRGPALPLFWLKANVAALVSCLLKMR